MKTTDKQIKQIAKLAYPDYNGSKFYLEAQKHPLDLRSSWQDGSRDYFRFVRLADLAVSAEVPAQSGYDRPVSGLAEFMVPEGFVVVRHVFFCGHDCGLSVIANPKNMAKLLPPTKTTKSGTTLYRANINGATVYVTVPQ